MISGAFLPFKAFSAFTFKIQDYEIYAKITINKQSIRKCLSMHLKMPFNDSASHASDEGLPM